jgi:hypothetical protein
MNIRARRFQALSWVGMEFPLPLHFAPGTMVTPALPLRFATGTIVSLRERE